MAPELLEEREDGSPVRPSRQSDIFSFGGIMLQVCLRNFRPLDKIINPAFRSSPTKFPITTSQMMQPSFYAYTSCKNLPELVIL